MLEILLAALLAVPAVPAAANDCLTCQFCASPEGGGPTLNCTDPATLPNCEDLPPAELAEPDVETMPAVQGLVARAVLGHWGSIVEVFGSPYRIYLPRHVWIASEQYPLAPAAQIRALAQTRFRGELIAEAAAVRLEHLRGEWHLRSNDALMTFVLSLLRRAGALTDAELAEVGAALELARDFAPGDLPPLERADSDSEAYHAFDAFADALRHAGAPEYRMAVQSALEVLR